jgi:hypothetical protein
MGENLGSKFARMSEEERRRFALEQDQAGGELAFDGTGALVDDLQHVKKVRKEARSRDKKQPRRTK